MAQEVWSTTEDLKQELEELYSHIRRTVDRLHDKYPGISVESISGYLTRKIGPPSYQVYKQFDVDIRTVVDMPNDPIVKVTK